jgi:hypothetical protein
MGFLKSGYTSAAITKRMARIAAMMMMPPRMTSREVHRSSAIRRLVRARETTSGRAGDAGPPALIASGLIANYWTLFSSSLAMDAGMGK